MSQTQLITALLVKEECCSCGLIFGIEQQHRNDLIKSHKEFYCPNGHRQWYTAETREEKLERELQRERAKADQKEAEARELQNSLRTTKGHVTRIKNRAANGVCICCNRSFRNLQQHMRKQHPELLDK